jgi:uncharacterized protein (DUF58 family)
MAGLAAGREWWWSRLRAKLEGDIRQRITRLGYTYAAATVLVGAAAFISANNLLFLLLSVMLAALLVSGLVSRLGLGGLEVDLELPPHLSARVPAVGRVRVRNHKSWMPSFSLHLEGAGEGGFSERLYIPLIPGGHTVEESVPLWFPKRGQYREGSFVFSSRFPFGFTERRVRVRIERDVIVYPSVLPEPEFELALEAVEGQLLARSPGGGDDFHRLRPYENESARHVDWKATARTGNLQVREYAARENPPVEIVFDAWCPASESVWFERAVDCCAYFVWSLHDRGQAFRFRTQTADLECPGEASAYDILKFLALVEPRALAAPIHPSDPNSACVLLSLRDARAVRLRAGAQAG